MFNLLLENPIIFLFVAIALIVSISIHEFAHAFVAHKLGDPTPKALGRVTLNPKAHLDLLGTLMLLVVGFGWGRPVPFNPTYLKNPKRDAALISFAGPGANFLLAVLLAILVQLVGRGGLIGSFLYLVVFYNLLLGFFNLIPLHPLDGFKVVNGFLTSRLSYQWVQVGPYGIYVLMLLALTGGLGRVLYPLVEGALGLLGLV